MEYENNLEIFEFLLGEYGKEASMYMKMIMNRVCMHAYTNVPVCMYMYICVHTQL